MLRIPFSSFFVDVLTTTANHSACYTVLVLPIDDVIPSDSESTGRVAPAGCALRISHTASQRPTMVVPVAAQLLVAS